METNKKKTAVDYYVKELIARASFYHPDGGYDVPQAGLTIRQYYAGMVLQGLLASGYNGTDNYVEQSVIITDLLIEQLNKSVEESSILEENPQNKFAGPEAGLSTGIRQNSVVSEMENTDREPKIGDLVYVWNIEGDEPQNGNLQSIGRYVGEDFKYMVNDYRWKYCSLKNPLIK